MPTCSDCKFFKTKECSTCSNNYPSKYEITPEALEENHNLLQKILAHFEFRTELEDDDYDRL
jgi:hypothetical protein